MGLPKTAPYGTSMWRFCSAIHGSANFWKAHPDTSPEPLGQLSKQRLNLAPVVAVCRLGFQKGRSMAVGTSFQKFAEPWMAEHKRPWRARALFGKTFPPSCSPLTRRLHDANSTV
ncbi:hypothetical protein F6453_1228 [Marinobacter nauticus]|uniref:Uncharacterized protein n=1 Tax=Marinobacter nauticus TaxID=2743 RepID=A0A833N9B1_MARNT|nr:hypothetical protein F6453_1228 [Marinobacter nauticus]